MNIGNPRTPIRNVMEMAFLRGLERRMQPKRRRHWSGMADSKNALRRIVVCDWGSVAQSVGYVQEESEYGSKHFFAP